MNSQGLFLKIICTVLVIGLISSFIGWFFFGNHLIPLVKPDQTITILENGKVQQSGQTIAKFHWQRASLLARIEMNSGESVRPTTFNLQILLPHPLDPKDLKLRIYSIQGTQNMAVYQTSPTSLQVNLYNVLPESHTNLEIQVPQNYLALPFDSRLIDQILAVPLALWVTLSGLILLCLLLLYLHLSQPFVKKLATERSLPPENLSAIEMAILLHSHLVARDVTALIYDLANRGFLEIVHNQAQVYFIRTSKEEELQNYEEMLLQLIAPRHEQPSSLQEILKSLNADIFSAAVSGIYIAVYNSLTKKAYFRENLRFIHLRYKTLGIIIQFISLFLFSLTYLLEGNQAIGLLIFALTLYLIGYSIYKIAYQLRPLTKKGRLITRQCQEFSQYLANPHPLAIDNTQGSLYFSYLSYALIFQGESEWRQRLRLIHFYIPTWFTTLTETFYTPEQFTASIEEIINLISLLFVQVKDPNVD